jgi:hypothetical protein
MCDTTVVVTDGGVQWLAKNSDREPGESQVIEHLPARPAQGPKLRATWVTIDEAAPSFEVVLSRPTWMWGAEMGVNEHGVAIANEAVFTRLPVAATGLTGMDLLRIALERSRTADSALELITGLIERYGQGGRCGYRNKGFRYHNAFVIADRAGAWLLETADKHWAAVRVKGARTTSNVLTIDEQPDRISEGTMDEAWRRGFWSGNGPFSFRKAFAQRAMIVLSGGDVRRACTLRELEGGDALAGLDLARHIEALRSHNGRDPSEGWRMEAPCAHSGPLPTKTAGQTTGSMIARISRGDLNVWATGTSAPCLSVFKPVRLGEGLAETGPAPNAAGSDEASLWWRHERLHRAVLQRGYAEARAVFEDDRRAFEARALAATTVAERNAAWSEHREQVRAWLARVEAMAQRSASPSAWQRASAWFWRRESRRDGL